MSSALLRPQHALTSSLVTTFCIQFTFASNQQHWQPSFVIRTSLSREIVLIRVCLPASLRSLFVSLLSPLVRCCRCCCRCCCLASFCRCRRRVAKLSAANLGGAAAAASGNSGLRHTSRSPAQPQVSEQEEEEERSWHRLTQRTAPNTGSPTHPWHSARLWRPSPESSSRRRPPLSLSRPLAPLHRLSSPSLVMGWWRQCCALVRKNRLVKVSALCLHRTAPHPEEADSCRNVTAASGGGAQAGVK